MNTKQTTPRASVRAPFNWAEWLLLGALALWVLVAVPKVIWGGPAIWGWFKHPAAAAWVQTIGVLLGIGVAIWVPWRQREHARLDAERNANVLAEYVVSITQMAWYTQCWTSGEGNEQVLVRLQTLARLWPSVTLGTLPPKTTGTYVALISITDQALALAKKWPIEAPMTEEHVAARWYVLCDLALHDFARLHSLPRPPFPFNIPGTRKSEAEVEGQTPDHSRTL